MLIRGLACLTLCLCGPILGNNACAQVPESRWKLVWSDEFDGERIDTTKWDFDLGNGYFSYDANQWIPGWGNGELQYYTRDPENAFVQKGELRIRALKESRDGFGYTSARLKSRKRDGTNLFSQRYGRFEFRAKLPTGQGIWPALWLLPCQDKYGTWAASGEIDVLEVRGQNPREILGTLHFGARWPANTEASHTYPLPAGQTVEDFHVFAVDWDPGRISWSVDGKTYATQTFWWSTSRVENVRGVPPRTEADLYPWPAPFDQPFYVVMNIAVGGKSPGNPSPETPFPAEMQVDYVRIYERAGGPLPLTPRGSGPIPFAPNPR